MSPELIQEVLLHFQVNGGPADLIEALRKELTSTHVLDVEAFTWGAHPVVGQFVVINEPLSGVDNNGGDIFVPAGEIWKVVDRGGDYFYAGHPSGVNAGYAMGGTLAHVRLVTNPVQTVNLRAAMDLTATRYVPAGVDPLLAAQQRGFVWDLGKPFDIRIESYD